MEDEDGQIHLAWRISTQADYLMELPPTIKIDFGKKVDFENKTTN